MASYYYLISSLPTLTTNSTAITYESFLGQCKTAVSDKVYKDLSNLSLSDMQSFNGCNLIREFGAFYTSLMTELAYQRNNKLERNISDSSVVDIVKAAMTASNPLAAEKILLDAQFEYADKLCSLHYFDDYVLFGYALKIRLLERKLIFEKEKGKKEFTRLFENIQQQINSI